MKLDRLEIERLQSNLEASKQKLGRDRAALNGLILERTNEVVGVIITTLGYKAYDNKGNMLFAFSVNCHCQECYGGDPDYNTHDCMFDNLEGAINEGIYILYSTGSKKWDSLSTGKHDYKKSGIPKEFLYTDDEDIKAHLEKEILASKITQEKRKKTTEGKKQEKEKVKKAALAKLTDEEKKILGVK